ncbi:MAG: phage portal protein [Candidatus Nanopelagicales bacterium]
MSRVIVSAGKSLPLGSLAQARMSVGPSAGLIPLLRADGAASTYFGMYRSQPWIFAVVNKITRGVSRLPLHSFQMGADGTRERERVSGLARLLSSPAPRTSGMWLRQQVAFSLCLYGNALVVAQKSPRSNEPSELSLVPWKFVKVHVDHYGVPIQYDVVVGGKAETLAFDNVVHYELPGGISPLEPLRRTLALEDAAMTWQAESLRNGITPRGAFVTKEKLAEQTLPRLREELAAMYAGAENAGRFGLFDQGLDWKQMGQSAVDAELINQRKLSREEVCAAYDMPPSQVGILDHATYSNTEQGRRSFIVDTLGPWLNMIEETLQAQLVRPHKPWDGLFVEHNTSEILRPDPEARARTHLMNAQSSVNTVNERRKVENLPRIDHPAADLPAMPVNMLPVTAVPTEPAQVEQDGSEPAGVPAQGLSDALTAAAFRGPGDMPPTISGGGTDEPGT